MKYIAISMFLVFAAIFGSIACTGVPRNVEQLDQMDEAHYALFLRRAESWALLGANELVKREPRVKEEVVQVADSVAALTTPTPTALADIADHASPLVAALLLEVQAWLDERGVLTSPHANEVLQHVAAGIKAGAGE